MSDYARINYVLVPHKRLVIWINKTLFNLYYLPVIRLLIFSRRHWKLLYRLNLWRYEHTPGRLLQRLPIESQQAISRFVGHIYHLVRWPYGVQAFYRGRCGFCGQALKVPFMSISSQFEIAESELRDRIWSLAIFQHFCPACFNRLRMVGIWKSAKGMSTHDRLMNKQNKKFIRAINDPGKGW